MKNILLTGLPGCGKTSLILEIIKKLGNLKAGGFYTSEIREKGVRKGFKISAIDGREAVMAHVDFKGTHKVGKYGVSVENLEKIGLKAINDAISGADIIVIDEIGKMEILYSEKMRTAIIAALDSGKKVIGTIMRASNNFADRIKKRKDVEIVDLIRGKADVVKERLIELLNSPCP